MRKLITAADKVAAVFLTVLVLAFGAPRVLTAAEPPRISDGLELKSQTRDQRIYLRPGARFSQYDRIALADCYVEFSKSWLRDYNGSTSLTHRISDGDLERAKQELAAQFRSIFTEELTRGGYAVADSAGPDVLLVRPALINVQMNAPDLMDAGRTLTIAQSAGAMTLYLELWDSAHGEILARVIDARSDQHDIPQPMTSVDNRAAAERVLRSWADEFVRKLDLARRHLG
jgi:Protein of unknown function (DUF3313)